MESKMDIISFSPPHCQNRMLYLIFFFWSGFQKFSSLCSYSYYGFYFVEQRSNWWGTITEKYNNFDDRLGDMGIIINGAYDLIWSTVSYNLLRFQFFYFSPYFCSSSKCVCPASLGIKVNEE